jgi:hypothetical protein
MNRQTAYNNQSTIIKKIADQPRKENEEKKIIFIYGPPGQAPPGGQWGICLLRIQELDRLIVGCLAAIGCGIQEKGGVVHG